MRRDRLLMISNEVTMLGTRATRSWTFSVGKDFIVGTILWDIIYAHHRVGSVISGVLTNQDLRCTRLHT